MLSKYIYIASLSISFTSCDSKQGSGTSQADLLYIGKDDSVKKNVKQPLDTNEAGECIFVRNNIFYSCGDKFYLDSLEPYWGYRHTLVGDFDGDGRQDTIIEKITDSTGSKDAAMWYNYPRDFGSKFDMYKADQLRHLLKTNWHWESINKKLTKNLPADPWSVKNVGDLDGDGRDELFYCPNNMCMSNICHAAIYSYSDAGWIMYVSYQFNRLFASTPQINTDYTISPNFKTAYSDSLFHDQVSRIENKFYQTTDTMVKKIKNRLIIINVYHTAGWNYLKIPFYGYRKPIGYIKFDIDLDTYEGEQKKFDLTKKYK